jgi:hypothetical protein
MKRWILTAAALAAAATVAAKLPAPDDAAKAKAAEAAAKTAWQAKVDAYQLCRVQDRIAATVRTNRPAQAPSASASASAPATAAKPAASSSDGSTPAPDVASAAPAVPPCVDPGPFAYAPPEQKPLESSGAHSPAATATSPPSVRAESGTMTSGKTGEAAKK